MESYSIGGVMGNALQTGHMHHEPSSRPRSSAPGRYGLSIRVQGIGGHPYVVLNNRDGGPQSNGHGADEDSRSSDADRSLKHSCSTDSGPHAENPFVEYHSQKQLQFGGAHSGMTDFREPQKKPSTLLNFQRHPELLRPYDPEKNSLDLDGFRSLPARPVTSAKPGSLHSSQTSHSRSSSQDKSSVPELPARQERTPQQSEPQSQPQPQSQPPVSKQKPQTETAGVARIPQEPVQLSPGTASSTSSSLERRPRVPDVLPLRRHDSSGPVLQSRHSSRSSTPPSSSTRTLADDPLDTPSSDPVNRHQNRRYIPFMPGTGRDIDTGSIPGVGELISKFDNKEAQQRRGRAGRRNRIDPEDRKRSRSVDSAFPFGLRGEADYLEQFSRNQGRSTEHVLRPSQLLLPRGAQYHDPLSPTSTIGSKVGSGARGSSTLGSPQGTVVSGANSFLGYKRMVSKSSTLPAESKREEEPKALRSVKVLTGLAATPPSTSMNSGGKTSSTERNAQATPDLLKGQQELSQQTNEETAKQILFNYLKDGSTDNDDTTKKKVNLVFEKIQTLKSRAAGNVQGDNKQTPDAAAEVKALQDQRKELEKEVAELRKRLEEETKKQASLADAREKAGSEKRDLQKELAKSQEECARLQKQLAKVEEELHNTTEELFQVKMEMEKYQTEIRDLQDQLSEMHDELDGAKRGEAESGEKEAILEDMRQLKLDFQDLLQVKEEQEDVLRRRERELTALKGALKEEVATHDQEVDTLREQYEQEIRKLLASVEDAKQSNALACREKEEVEAARGAAESRAERLALETDRLRRRAQELENEVAKLNRIVDEAKLQENRLAERVRHLEKENQQLEESLAEVKEQEEAMSRANRALTTRLEDVQRNLTKLTQDHKELNERLKEERVQKEQVQRTKNEIEDERRLLDHTVEKLQKEMGEIVEASQNSTQELQVQIDEYKEKNRKELTELRRQLHDRSVELESSRMAARKLEEEVCHMEEDLRQCKNERDEAILREKRLDQKVYDLEVELETVSHSKDEKPRHIKVLEDRISQLEMDLEEERNSADLLMDRIDQGREQVGQMRSELLQERAARQDLECDKIALERQNKDLKSRVAHLEGSQKSNKESLVSQLESRIQELEERLEAEERDRANLQLVNRRLERKVKEMIMQVDDEHLSLQDQKDQLNLRLKALKRQMSEAEEEIEHLEHGKKKLQRELEEQTEANEQLQGQLKALRIEMRRKTASAAPLNDLADRGDDDDDDVSTDGEVYYRSASGYKRSSQDTTS